MNETQQPRETHEGSHGLPAQQRYLLSNAKNCPTVGVHLRLRFSLRMLFVMISVAAVWFGFLVYHSRQQKAAILAIKSVGGNFYYDYQCDGPLPNHPNASPPGPGWLWSWLDQDFFFDVVNVGLDRKPATDDTLLEISRLGNLQELELTGTPNVTDAGLQHLTGLKRLEVLRLFGTSISQSALDEFERTHPMTYVLYGSATRLTPTTRLSGT